MSSTGAGNGKMKKVAILGAGISGLSVAWGLSKDKFDIDIIESENEIGGLSGSFRKDGYVFDYGPHNFYTKDPEIFYKVKGLLKDELVLLDKMYSSCKIIFNKKHYDYPLRIPSVLSNMPLSTSLACLSDYSKSSIKRKLFHVQNKSFEDWIVNHFGRTLYHLFFGPFTEKTWGVSPQLLASNFASERIPKLNLWKMACDLLHPKKQMSNSDKPHEGEHSPNYSYYPLHGFWKIGDLIKKDIESAKGRINLKSQIKELTINDGHISNIIFETNGYTKEIQPDFVVSTIPITELAKVLHPLDEETKQAGSKMKYRELTLLFLEVDKPKVFDARLLYFHDQDILFQRGSEIKFYSEELAPMRERTGLVLEITNKNNLTESEIYNESITGLEKMGFLKRGEVLAYHIVRKPHSYPLYDLDYKKNLNIFLNDISKINNLLLSGRQSLFRYIDADQCIKMGLILADHIKYGHSLNEMNNVFSDWSEAFKH